MRQIDPEAVQAFVLVADLKSFTRAARALNTTQSAVSLKISRLEQRLDRRLFERTPRLVRLTSAGEAFLVRARALADSYRRVVETFDQRPGSFVLGISHHIICDDLPELLKNVRALPGDLVLDLRIAGTRVLLDSYDAGELDAVILLKHDESRRLGEVVLTEHFQWMASPDFSLKRNMPIPLILQREPCQLRAMAISTLEKDGLAWREAFLGTGVSSISAAAVAGLGIALVARRVAPSSLVDVGEKFDLPKPPSRPVILHSNLTASGSQQMLARLISAFRSSQQRLGKSVR